MPRAGLTRAVIAADAAELADEIGWDQLTLAAVAARFGVRQPSLYKHVAGLAELRRDVSVLAGRELHDELTAAAVGRSGADALQAMAEAYRTFAKKHPGRYAAGVIAPPPGDTEYEQVAEAVVRTVSAVLAGYGLTGDDAIHAIRGLRALMHGFVSLEAAGGFAHAAGPGRELPPAGRRVRAVATAVQPVERVGQRRSPLGGRRVDHPAGDAVPRGDRIDGVPAGPAGLTSSATAAASTSSVAASTGSVAPPTTRVTSPRTPASAIATSSASVPRRTSS